MKTYAGKKNNLEFQKKNGYNTKKQETKTVAPAHIKCPGDLKHVLDSQNTSKKWIHETIRS